MRFAQGAVALTLLVPPFLVMTGARESFRLPKLLASEWLAIASLLACAWRLRGAGACSVRTMWRQPAVRAVTPLIAVAAAGVFTSAHPAHYREAMADLTIGAACVIGWSLALARPSLEQALRFLLWPALGLALLGIDQALGLFGALSWLHVQEVGRYAITSTAGNTGDLAGYVVLPMLMAQWVLSRAAPRWERGLAALALAAGLSVVALTQTITATLAIALGSTVLWARLLPRRRLGFVAVAAVVVLTVGLAVAPSLRARIVQKATQAHSGNLNDVLTGRLDAWRAATHMFVTHPWAGVGQGGFRPEYIPAKLALLDRGVTFYPKQHLPVLANAHNEWLEVAAELGIAGLLAAAWGLVVVLGSVRRLDSREASLGWAGLAGLLTLTMADFPFRVALVAFPALVFLAWVLAPTHEEGRSPGGRTAFWIAVPLLALGLAWQTKRTHDRLLASQTLAHVEALTVAAVQVGRAPADLLPANLERLRRVEPLDRSEVGLLVAKGTQHLLLRDTARAIAAYQEALALEPRPEIYLNLGRAERLAGSHDAARSWFALAVRADPGLRSQVPSDAF